jgi:XTP/dITP diphosphohydrolase
MKNRLKNTWVLASENAGKVKEFNILFANTPYLLQPQSDFNIISPPETGLTFIENAIAKARYTAAISGLPTLADDSGLVVDYLNGKPGIYSARYAGEPSNAKANNEKLLEALKNIPHPQRSAHFYCILVLLRHAEDPEPLIAEGRWHGNILPETIGDNGFGYDPIFYVPSHDCSSAELAPEIKNQISHRALAFKQLLTHLSVG